MAKLFSGPSSSSSSSQSYPSLVRSNRRRKKLVGLFNPSNYCFANVCVQVCFHIEPFRIYFLANIFKQHISPKRDPNVSSVLAEMFAKLADERNELVNLQKMLKVMGSDYFTIGYIHHDSFEFLLSVLDKLDEELNCMPNHQFMFYIPTVNPLRSVVEKNWNAFSESKGSIVKQLFYGTECSIFTCIKCQHNSYSSEPSIMFSVALPQKVVQVYFFRKEPSSTIQCIEVACKCDDGTYITVETVICQLSLMFKIQIHDIMLCHVSKDFESLYELDWTAKIVPQLKLVAFETPSMADHFYVDLKVESSLLAPLVSICAHCFNQSDSLKKCSICRTVAYCNSACQKNDWPLHKGKCQHKQQQLETDSSKFTDVGIQLVFPLDIELDDLNWDFFEENCLKMSQRFLEFTGSQVSLHESNNNDVHLTNGFGNETLETELFEDVQCTSGDALVEDLNSVEDIWFSIEDFNESGQVFSCRETKSNKCSIHSSKRKLLNGDLKVGIIATFEEKHFDQEDVNRFPNFFDGRSEVLEISLHDLDKTGWTDFVEMMKCSSEIPLLTLYICSNSTTQQKKPPSNQIQLEHNSRNWAVVKEMLRNAGSNSVIDCRRATLQQCFNSHFAPIRVSERSCDNCKEKCDSIKYSYCWNLPSYLFIHFKRAAEFQNLAKLSTAVEFPLDELDLSSFAAIGQTDIQSYSSKYRYRLHSLVQHHGRLQVKGHYTCYVRVSSNIDDNSNEETEHGGIEVNLAEKSEDEWYHFDDDHITRASEQSVAKAEPYVLVYENISHHAKTNISQIFNSFC